MKAYQVAGPERYDLVAVDGAELAGPGKRARQPGPARTESGSRPFTLGLARSCGGSGPLFGGFTGTLRLLQCTACDLARQGERRAWFRVVAERTGLGFPVPRGSQAA